MVSYIPIIVLRTCLRDCDVSGVVGRHTCDQHDTPGYVGSMHLFRDGLRNSECSRDIDVEDLAKDFDGVIASVAFS